MARFFRNKGRMLSADITTNIQDRRATEGQGQRGQRGVMGSLQLNPKATGRYMGIPRGGGSFIGRGDLSFI